MSSLTNEIIAIVHIYILIDLIQINDTKLDANSFETCVVVIGAFDNRIVTNFTVPR